MRRILRSVFLVALANCSGPAAASLDTGVDGSRPIDENDGASSLPTDAFALDAVADSLRPPDGVTVLDAPDVDAPRAVDADAAAPGEFDRAVGFTDDFRAWLAAQRATDAAGWTRADLPGGSFGGRARADQVRTHVPIVFVHGNSDRAVGGPLGGWTQCLRYFLDTQGYSTGELFATTWGPADPARASAQYHSRAYLTGLRGFVLAVLAYTDAPRVHLVSHSMGVTLARKLVLGGPASDALDGGRYDLGAPLTDRVQGFVGIAGANRGLVGCYSSGPSTPTCGATNGFYPGTLGATGDVVGRSAFLENLLAQRHYEGAFVAAVWSEADTLIGYRNIVYGVSTSAITGQDAEQHYGTEGPDHLALKDACAVHAALLRRAEGR